jgi:hypothetical protein
VERSECECKEGNMWARHTLYGRPGMGCMHVWVLLMWAPSGRLTAMLVIAGEIASGFEKVACGSRVDYNWWGGGNRFGIDDLANIVYIISLFIVFCRPSRSLLTPLKVRDEIVGVSAHRVQDGCSGLMALSRVVARGTCVTAVCGVTMGPAVTARAFDRCRGRDGRNVGI